MADTSKVLEVLREARGLVELDWGSGRDAGTGTTCASVGMGVAKGDDFSVGLAAHVAFLRGAGVNVPADEDATYNAVYAFNDAQASREPVLAAFDKAIVILEAEVHPLAFGFVLPREETPNADSLIDVLGACRSAGEVVARHIVSEHPEMDAADMATLAAAELFYAAQDTARVATYAAQA